MKHIIISGGKKLQGEFEISGSKNATLPILSATLLSDKKVQLKNVPDLLDTKSMLHLLKSLGVIVDKKLFKEKKVLNLNAHKITSLNAKYELVRKMRASFLVLGPLLTRMGKAKVSLPGGCAIGTRPVNLHLQAMRKLGASIYIEDGYVTAKSPRNGLVGNHIIFSNISVGATENAIMAAVLAKGETKISNAAREPEITDLCNFLLSLGARIEGAGTKTISIQGVSNLGSTSYSILFDRIEACTYIVAGAITNSNVVINLPNSNSDHLKSFLLVMKKMGLNFKVIGNKVKVFKGQILSPIKVKTEEYPGFPTDMQAQLMTLMCLSRGTSEITENIFENRFMHVPELNRLGADIKINGNRAVIEGNRKLIGAEVMATDLRASVSLILAGLVAKGDTKINRIYHLDRGYENIDKKLSKCGAKIIRGFTDE